jgi:hypothetical protein
MKSGLRIAFIIMTSLIVSLFITLPALAVPQLPASFYGTVKVNAANVPDGTSIQALIGGHVYAETITQTYQGDSVYALNVTGDDTDTPAVDGGREGDTVQFKIGGVLASQTGIWHSGTNVSLNLTASTSNPIATPAATPTTVPTQTAIPTLKPTVVPATPSPASPTAITPVQPSPVATATSQVSLTQTSPAQPTLVATQPAHPSPVSTTSIQPSPTSAGSKNQPGKGSGNFTTIAVVVMVTLVVAMIVGYIFLVLREKKK